MHEGCRAQEEGEGGRVVQRSGAMQDVWQASTARRNVVELIRAKGLDSTFAKMNEGLAEGFLLCWSPPYLTRHVTSNSTHGHLT